MRITVLISGGGTTLKNLIEKRSRNRLEAEIAHVISNNSQAGGLKYAHDADISTSIVDHKQYSGMEDFSEVIFQICRDRKTDLVVMGGFLRRVKIPNDFVNRVINIHPSLIPAFCGHGFYGNRVHQAVIDYGCKLSGCTVHFVDDEFDHGPIIDQATVPVLPHDSAADLAARVFEKECELYPAVINRIAGGTVKLEGRVVEIATCQKN